MIRAINDQNIIIDPYFPGKYRTVFMSENDVRNSWVVHVANAEQILDVLSLYEFIDKTKLRQIIYDYGRLTEWRASVPKYYRSFDIIKCSWDDYFTRFPVNEITLRFINNAQILRKLLKIRSDRKKIMNKLRNYIRYRDIFDKDIKTVFAFLAAS